MRTIAFVAAATLFGCSSARAPVAAVAERVAVVVEYVRAIRPLDAKSDRVYMQVARQVHATAIVTELRDIDEDKFDAVVVLKPSSGFSTELNYDVSNTQSARDFVDFIPYEIRRDQHVNRSGNLRVTYRFGRMDRSAEVDGMGELIRKLQAPTSD